MRLGADRPITSALEALYAVPNAVVPIISYLLERLLRHLLVACGKRHVRDTVLTQVCNSAGIFQIFIAQFDFGPGQPFHRIATRVALTRQQARDLVVQDTTVGAADFLPDFLSERLCLTFL